MKIISRVLIISILLNSCSSTKSEDTIPLADTTTQKAESTDLANEIKVFSLPAPLQIPYELKKLNPRFYEHLLKPSNSNPENIATNFKKALNLGIYAVDLGYTTTYDQRQTAINYLSACIKLAEQLNISTKINSSLVDRYKKNISNRDSLNVLIIKTFAEINRTLTESNRQADAALILTGSFIEGVHLSTGIYEESNSELLVNLIGQQKLFLNNLLEILAIYHSDEIYHLVKNLKELKTDYDQIEISYTSSSDSTKKEIAKINAPDKLIGKIGKKVRAMRVEIIT
jgi:hypothetical protein